MTIEDRLRESLRDPGWEAGSSLRVDDVVRRARRRDRLVAAGAVLASAAAVVATVLVVNVATGSDAIKKSTPLRTPTPPSGPVVTTPVLGVTKSGKYVIQQPDGTRLPVHVEAPAHPVIASAFTGGWIVSVAVPVKCLCPDGGARLALVRDSGRVRPFGGTWIGTITSISESPDDRSVAFGLESSGGLPWIKVEPMPGESSKVRSWELDRTTQNSIVSVSWGPDQRRLTFIAGDNTGAGTYGDPITFGIHNPRYATAAPEPPATRGSECQYSSAAWSGSVRGSGAHLFGVGYCLGAPAEVRELLAFPADPDGMSPVRLSPRDCLDGVLHASAANDILLLRWCGEVYRVDRGEMELVPGGFTDAAALTVFTAAGTGSGEVVGTLTEVGGPPPGLSRPVEGKVEAHRGSERGRVVATATVGPDGQFTLQLPPGQYVLTGSPIGVGPCAVSPALDVTAGETVRARHLVCPVP